MVARGKIVKTYFFHFLANLVEHPDLNFSTFQKAKSNKALIGQGVWIDINFIRLVNKIYPYRIAITKLCRCLTAKICSGKDFGVPTIKQCEKPGDLQAVATCVVNVKNVAILFFKNHILLYDGDRVSIWPPRKDYFTN